MPEQYEVIVKVISQEGRCGAGHKVGDEWILEGKSPAGMCMNALIGLYPHARALMLGGQFPWGPDPNTIRHACPDSRNPLVFEIKRGKQLPPPPPRPKPA
jgi:uncharacterized repeat protein (TIGR04076 family)